MERQIIDQNQPLPLCPDSLEQPGRRAYPTSRKPAAPPPVGYDPIAEIKRRHCWEQIFDFDGTLWDVREARATKHGFDLLFGFPANSALNTLGGPNRLIATPALVAYWEANRFAEGPNYDLPAGRTTLKRVRARLRFNFVKDRRNLWKKRSADLQTLPTREFAERYHVTKEMTNAWRHKLVGPATRPLNWWHHPEALAVLRDSRFKLREICQALAISITHAKRLRAAALALPPDKVEQQSSIDAPVAKLPYLRPPTIPPVKQENPFFNHRKQGVMFVGSSYWRRAPKPQNGVPAETPATQTRASEARETPGSACSLEDSGPKRNMPTHPFSQRTAQRTGQLLLFHPPRDCESRPMLFQVQDFVGTFYDVYETRPTNHGFDLLFGYPTKAHRRLYAEINKPGLIPTAELVAYWDAHRIVPHANFDLPAGKTTLIRLRGKLGFNMKRDEQLAKRQVSRPS